MGKIAAKCFFSVQFAEKIEFVAFCYLPTTKQKVVSLKNHAKCEREKMKCAL